MHNFTFDPSPISQVFEVSYPSFSLLPRLHFPDCWTCTLHDFWLQGLSLKRSSSWMHACWGNPVSVLVVVHSLILLSSFISPFIFLPSLAQEGTSFASPAGCRRQTASTQDADKPGHDAGDMLDASSVVLWLPLLPRWCWVVQSGRGVVSIDDGIRNMQGHVSITSVTSVTYHPSHSKYLS